MYVPTIPVGGPITKSISFVSGAFFRFRAKDLPLIRDEL